MFKIGKMKVDNLVVLTLLYSLIWIFLSHAMCKFVLCIKRAGGFPNNIMVLVATLGIDIALTTKLD